MSYSVVPYVVLGVSCLLVGFALGARRARKVKRRVLQELNAQSLELLDTRSSLNALEHYTAQQGRRDKLLKLALRKLKETNDRCRSMALLMARQNRKHYMEMSRLRLRAVESRETAIKAAAIARQATAHLKRLENASPVIQTIEAPAPKSYGTGDPVTVSVVDQARADAPRDAITPVSNRDSARLTKLHSSNEATAQTL
jgi:hypothetical protein